MRDAKSQSVNVAQVLLRSGVAGSRGFAQPGLSLAEILERCSASQIELPESSFRRHEPLGGGFFEQRLCLRQVWFDARIVVFINVSEPILRLGVARVGQGREESERRCIIARAESLQSDLQFRIRCCGAAFLHKIASR